MLTRADIDDLKRTFPGANESPHRDDVPLPDRYPESADGERDDLAEAAETAKSSAEAMPRSKAAPAERWQDTLAQDKDIKTVDFRTLLEEDVIEEPALIEPNLAEPPDRGPAQGAKSLLLQEMLVSCALGVPFLLNTFTVGRPLRVFYLQAEMNRNCCASGPANSTA